MTKKIITLLLVIGLIAITVSKLYNKYNQVQLIGTSISAPEDSKTVHKEVTIKKKKTKNTKVTIPVVTPETKEYIDSIFGDNAKIATATFMHESGLVLDKVGYNCFYYKEDGKRYSTSCKTKEDRKNAWSVDCGLPQINVKGQTCPAELLTLEGAMKAAENKYKTQGLEAWVSYTSGAYKKFLGS